MKKLHYILALIIVLNSLISCGGGGDDPPTPPPPQNNKPTTPTLSAPENNLLCIDNVLDFSWSASTDPDGDAISYQLQIATDNQFTQNLQSFTENSATTQITLDKGQAYYWRVKAIDSKNESSNYSSTFQFYTEGEGTSNHLPFAPTIVKPVLNSVVQEATATLEWTASDVDNDPLTYYVYFGTDNPPATKVSENQTETTFSVDLTATTDYYWKIVVKDDKDAQTIGQVWNFKTD